jgi:excisionase family DNA binding protein
MEAPLPAVLTIARAAQELSVSASTLYRMLRAQELTSVRIHKRAMIPASEIRRLSTPEDKPGRKARAKTGAAPAPVAGFDATRFRALRRR